MDLVNFLSDVVKLRFLSFIINYSTVTLWFKITFEPQTQAIIKKEREKPFIAGKYFILFPKFCTCN